MHQYLAHLYPSFDTCVVTPVCVSVSLPPSPATLFDCVQWDDATEVASSYPALAKSDMKPAVAVAMVFTEAFSRCHTTTVLPTGPSSSKRGEYVTSQCCCLCFVCSVAGARACCHQLTPRPCGCSSCPSVAMAQFVTDVVKPFTTICAG